MSYLKKYLKYQSKYFNLINNHLLIGGSILDSDNIANIYTKDDYDKIDLEEQNKFPFYCPVEKPYICSKKTKNYGLCKTELDECNEYSGEQTYPIYDLNEERTELLDYGKKFNYDLYKFNDKDCSKLIINSFVDYDIEPYIFTSNFKIMTWNLWWSMKITGNKEQNKFHYDFFVIRMKVIAEEILNSDVDIVCLQEVGELTFNIIYHLINSKYPYYYENPIHFDKDNDGPRRRSLECMCFSKYPANGFKSIGVQGNLHYNNSILVLEYEQFIIFNVYLQAGSRNSPGQKDLWFNYSRCRYNEYLAIDNYIKENEIKKPIIILGDFNTNLNGKYDEWPELVAFKQMNLEDAWLKKYDNDSGFTENTKVNLMRWNVKFEEKQLRIDGIFYNKDAFILKDIKIIGDKPIDIDDDMQKQFYKYRIPNKDDKDKQIRKNGDQLQLWPSDHFAIIAEFTLSI